LGLVAAAVIIMIALTGIVLVHRKSLGLDKVSLRAPGYGVSQIAPDAWDMLPLPSGDLLVATKQGLFLRSGAAWRMALPHQVRKLHQRGNALYACAKQGLYASGDSGATWEGLLTGREVKALHFRDGRILAATPKGIFATSERIPAGWETVVSFEPQTIDVREFRHGDEGFFIIAKEGVFTAREGGTPSREPLPAAGESRGTVDLQKLITDIHSGEFFGKYFFAVIDASAAGMVVLTLTGIYVWYIPRRMRQRR
jgi:hypothetical protein